MLYDVMVKNSPANTRDTGDIGLILGAGRSSGVEMATHSSILAWRMLWTEEPGGLQSLGLQRVQWKLAVCTIFLKALITSLLLILGKKL